MHKDKLQVFQGLFKKEPSRQHAELQKQAEKMMQEAALIKGLMEHPGWKLLKEFFDKKKEVLIYELKICTEKELIRLQEKSKIIDEFEAFLYSKIIRDPDL